MNNAWSDERGKMNENTVRGPMVCKINFGLTSDKFYDKTMNGTTLFKNYH